MARLHPLVNPNVDEIDDFSDAGRPSGGLTPCFAQAAEGAARLQAQSLLRDVFASVSLQDTRSGAHQVKRVIAAIFSILAFASSAQAALLISFQEVGSDVVATMSGSLDLTGMIATGPYAKSGNGIAPIGGVLSTGAAPPLLDGYLDQLTGPASFGAGGVTVADSSTGDAVGLVGNANDFYVPAGYVSGAALAGTMTFLGESFATLGVALGDTVYTLDSGDTFTVRFAAQAVPLPGSLPLMLAGLATLAAVARRRRG